MHIIPSLLVKSKEEFLSQLDSLDHMVTHLQLDIADGQFVPTLTWSDPAIIASIEGYTFELHLMDLHPLETIALWKDIPSITRLIIHVESVTNLSDAIEHARTFGREVFIALNPETKLEVIETVHTHIDGVLFMGVKPGFQGQTLIPEVLEKIAQCRKKYPDLYTELDGGVQEDTLAAIVESAVHAICPGSLVFRHTRSAREQIIHLKQKINKLKAL